ncbi:catechol 2,3-dioxygenase-like lactoylglutathione lyase family enzyme [Bradyrhizobium sp. AZCC 2230]
MSADGAQRNPGPPVARVARSALLSALVRQGVALLSPPTNQPFGHRTLFFRDPDGNLLEVYAEI